MGVSRPKPRFTASTIIIYTVIVIVAVLICSVLGCAMDFSVNPDGSLDITKIGEGLTLATKNIPYIMKHLVDKNSYVFKMEAFGLVTSGIIILYQFSKTPKRLHRKGEEYGSAKWGDEKEMKDLAEKEKKPEFKPVLRDGKRVFDNKGNFVGFTIDNNTILTKEVQLSLNFKQHFLNHNVVVIGGSGAGKSRYYARPNIMQLNTSYVVTDPKGELLADTGKMLEEAGYKVRVFNLIEMEHSNNYNPFEYVYDYNGNLSEESVMKMVDILFNSTKVDGEKEDFWSQKGKAMLEAVIFLLFEESEYNMKRDTKGKLIPETRDKTHLNFFSVTEKMRRLQYPLKGRKDGYFLQREDGESDEEYYERRCSAFLCPLDKDFLELEKRKPNSIALRLYKEVRNAPEETGQSFLSSANVKTFMFNMENIFNLTCCDNINLNTLGDEKTAVFVLISATSGTFYFLASMMYTQLFDTLSNVANFKYASNGRRLKVPVRFIMDEFANISQIPDFEKVIAFVRSMGMSIDIIIQNLAQLKAKYEKHFEVITGNCDSLLFLGGKEESTLKSISEQLGKETIDIVGKNRTKARQSSTSENNSIVGRELMQPNEISTMPISDCILLIRSHNPFYCKKYPLEKHPNYGFLAAAAETAEEFEERSFQISSIHAISVKELNKSKVDTNSNDGSEVVATSSNGVTESVDTNINVPEFGSITETVLVDNNGSISPDTDILTVFENTPITVYGEEMLTDENVEYGQITFDFESVDLGESIKGKEEISYDGQEQVTPDIVNSDGSIEESAQEDTSTTVESEYEVPEVTASTIENLTADEIEEAYISTSENSPLSDEVLDLDDVETDEFNSMFT